MKVTKRWFNQHYFRVLSAAVCRQKQTGNINFRTVQYEYTAIKNVIKDNPRVILYFGSDWKQFVAVNKATGGFAPEPMDKSELCILYADGKYDGFNRENSIDFFKMNFHMKKAYYARWAVGGREEEKEWLLVDLSYDRKARVVWTGFQ